MVSTVASSRAGSVREDLALSLLGIVLVGLAFLFG
jgi:hypothetical protein